MAGIPQSRNRKAWSEMIYLFRHAQSEANKGILYGTDMPLSPEGVQQAMEFRGKTNIKPMVAISSRKKRAVQTRNILFPNASHEETDIFDEINFGELEHMPVTPENGEELSGNPMLIKTKYNGDDIWERADRAIRTIEYLSCIDCDVAIVLHDTLYQAICWKLTGKHKKPYCLWGNGKEYLYRVGATEEDHLQQTFHLGNCECAEWESIKKQAEQYH